MEAVYSEKRDCSGCAACRDICPALAIEMRPDEEGFLYPDIDQDSCLDCGACISACPLNTAGNFKHSREPVFYVARHKSDDVLKASTSGGAFTALSDAVLRTGGTVYGADFDEDFRVTHKCANTPAERDRMRFSKYVQSDLRPVFNQLGSDLESGRPVLFTGTPCQTAAIRSRFQDHPHSNNLYICDLICHSIPSPRIWADYVKLLEREAGGRMTAIQFRSKKYAWSRANSNKGLMYRIEGEDGLREDDRFYQLFIQKNLISRPSCHHCRFTDIHRCADITIADYFGIEEFEPNWYDPLGVSLILVNSPRGRQLLEWSAGDINLEQRAGAEALSQQKRLSAPGAEPELRKKFWEIYLAKGLEEALNLA